MKLSHERFFHVVASLKSSDGVEKEQRRQPRVGMRAAVLIAPLVDGGEPGTPYSVRVHDISSEGCSFQHLRALCKGAQFVIDLPEAQPSAEDEAAASAGQLRIVCRAIHCRMAGEHKFVIGAQFVRLWTAPAPTLDAARAAA